MSSADVPATSGGSHPRRDDMNWAVVDLGSLPAGVFSVHPEAQLHRHDADCCWDCYAGDPVHPRDADDYACRDFHPDETEGLVVGVQGAGLYVAEEWTP